ncbi:MAG: hypothetical protein USCAAHI_01714 [Beijerinckiaceae bacterium]|nr:MAG: hypothetical protein USCAAHI_01714 [Beijerinckiaceae bacterium]
MSIRSFPVCKKVCANRTKMFHVKHFGCVSAMRGVDERDHSLQILWIIAASTPAPRVATNISKSRAFPSYSSLRAPWPRLAMVLCICLVGRRALAVCSLIPCGASIRLETPGLPRPSRYASGWEARRMVGRSTVRRSRYLGGGHGWWSMGPALRRMGCARVCPLGAIAGSRGRHGRVVRE